MRHRKSRGFLNRFTSWRQATLLSLAKNLLIHQSIRTSLSKAKAARPLAERLISQAKRNTLAAKREAFRILGEHALVKVLFDEIGPRFSNRQSGFTRIINLGRRRGDDAEIVILELTEIKKKEKKVHKKEKETKPQEQPEAGPIKEKPAPEKKTETAAAVKEKPPITKKPTKKFLGGLRNIFKKERDSL
jgi:large subunit ribosomal protein L17